MMRLRHGNGYLLTVLVLVSTINWADRQVVPILFPGLRAELGLSDTQLGIIGGLAFSLIYALTVFVFGAAADGAVRVRVVAFGLAVWSVATASGAFATGFWSLFAARFFTGVGEASLYPCALSLIAERFPPARRGRALGIFGSSAAIGAGVGIALGGRLAQTLGWRHVFLLYGAAGLTLVPLVLSVPEVRRPRSAAASDPPWRIVRALVTDPRLLALWLAGLVAITAGLGYAAWVPSFFVRARGVDVTGAGLLFGGAALIGGIVGSLLGGHLADRRDRARARGAFDVSLAAALVAAPLILFTIESRSPWLFVPGGLIGSTAIYAIFPPLQSAMLAMVPRKRHGMTAAVNTFFLGGIGSALGPFVVGAISDATGSLETAMLAPVAGLVLAAFLTALAARVARR